MTLSTSLRAFAIAAIALAAPAALAQPTTAPAAPPTPLATAISDAVSFCVPQNLSVSVFEQRAGAAGWHDFRSAPASDQRQWRLSDRTADPQHRVSLAASNGDLSGAPSPTRQFNCKIVLQPGAESDVDPALTRVFGEGAAEGGFFIVEHDTLRPQTFEENLTQFPASLATLHAGQRMIFLQSEQRGAAVVVSIDTFQLAAR